MGVKTCFDVAVCWLLYGTNASLTFILKVSLRILHWLPLTARTGSYRSALELSLCSQCCVKVHRKYRNFEFKTINKR